jgi:hypothetical protein
MPRNQRLTFKSETMHILFTVFYRQVTICNTKLSGLFSASREHQNEVGKEIPSHEENILNGKISFEYHRNCRSTYSSKFHIQKGLARNERLVASVGGGDVSVGEGYSGNGIISSSISSPGAHFQILTGTPGVSFVPVLRRELLGLS